VPDGVRNYPSHLGLSPDGRTIFLSNRGVDCLTAFVVSGESLVAVADYPTHGRWPRHFGGDGSSSVFVASQDDDRVVLLEVDGAGVLTDTGRRVAVGSPTCVVTARLD
jgi:6-phosphogluconolactonase